MSLLPVVLTDGGRAAAGFKGHAGDCVTRAIAIATERPYREVYDELNRRTEPARKRGKSSSARTGIPKRVIREYLDALGWRWTPTMGIGTGCWLHLRADEIPPGRLIVSVSKHLTVVIDRVIHDTHDPQREGTRCVYGYWRQA